ncbi:hypothetical protein [Roseobacter weihaiensis]|uniref:hypothetical protein n=1 Tax=Roseobacter weihaiensis TaxID=2763262 RepID=UPI001D09C3CE|nr:hypothetical protein [Roseobacter sp. H9]
MDFDFNYDTAAAVPVIMGQDNPDTMVVLQAVEYVDERGKVQYRKELRKTVLIAPATEDTPPPAIQRRRKGKGPGFPTYYKVDSSWPITDLGELEATLQHLLKTAHPRTTNAYKCVIRGAITQASASIFRRIFKKSDPRRAIVDVPRRWIMFDVDCGPPFPEGWEQNPKHWARYLIRECLPPELHDAGCIVRWSSSMLGGARDISKAHVWCLSDRPVSSQEMQDWTYGFACDRSLFQPGHVHYTAEARYWGIRLRENADPDGPPLALPGLVKDPLPRLLRLNGPRVKVPTDIEPFREKKAKMAQIKERASSATSMSVQERAAEIVDYGPGGDATGKPTLHHQLLSLAGAYVNEVYPDGSFEELQQLVAHVTKHPLRDDIEFALRMNEGLRGQFRYCYRQQSWSESQLAERAAEAEEKHRARVAAVPKPLGDFRTLLRRAFGTEK